MARTYGITFWLLKVDDGEALFSFKVEALGRGGEFSDMNS